ncbi:thioredoxin domain-containing protein [bacterium]|nr:thioredoxin domain-containing protein [bacterium]
MNSPTRAGSAVTATLLCGLLLGSGACRKSPDLASVAPAAAAPVIAAELQSNRLGSLPGAIYRSQAKSPIRWQPWTRESLQHAKDAKRLVFAVVAMPQQPGFQSVLAALAADSALTSAINDNYVPVLVDGDAAREIGLLTADLCAEIKRGLQLPLFIWITPDGNPVAWIPVASSGVANVGELFQQSHSMVSRMWAEDSAYVMTNSALDQASRRGRIGNRRNTEVMSKQPAETTIRGLRQLISFYDPYSRSFDEAGGLFPAGAVDLLATAALQPGLPDETRARCLETTRELLTDLLPSAMFDPLEGGVFSSRQGNSWAFPNFFRDCVSQARVAVALIHGYRATGDPRAMDKALSLISFAEKSFTTPEGLFAVGMAHESSTAAWLWSVEEIQKELPPEDAAWWIRVTGMKGLGNLPFDVDPRREHFRSNSLAIGKSLADLAAELGQPLATFAPRFEQIRKTLLKARNTRLGPTVRDESSHAGATFRMVSAYAAAFGVTGDEKFRTSAVALLGQARTAFSDGPKLRLFSKDAPSSIGEGRAFLYGLALQAALDVADITADEKWLDWSENLATTAAELFTSAEFLKECPDDAKIIDLPITDLVMLFDDSTAGLISSAECRLAERGRPLVANFSALATPLPTYAADRPILHTDLLQATLARQNKVLVITGSAISPELRLATDRLPLRMIQRRAANPEDEIPRDAVKVILGDREPRLVATPAALAEALLPSPEKR